jgi:hypothetical protein
MPTASRRAMLDSVGRDEILVGAYTNKSGGVCPMLGAHRRGGRCDLAEFARAWDNYTGVRTGEARPATDRELRTLESMLEHSLAHEPGPTDLGWAIAEFKAARRRRLEAPGRVDLADAVEEVKASRRRRAAEAARRLGLGWLRGLETPADTAGVEPESSPPAPVEGELAGRS